MIGLLSLNDYDPSSMSGSNRQENLRQLKFALELRLKSEDGHTNRLFLTEEILHDFWTSQLPIIRKELEGYVDENQDLNALRRVCCILIAIDPTLIRKKIPLLLSCENLKDETLPWNADDVREHLGVYAADFVEYQHLYLKPFILGQGQGWERYRMRDLKRPLPYLSQSRIGLKGNTFRVVIQKRCLLINGIKTDQNTDVVCHVLRNPSAKDIRTRMPTSGLTSLRSHANIVQHYADLLEQSHSPVLLTFKAYTPLGDLDTFLSTYTTGSMRESSHRDLMSRAPYELQMGSLLDAFAGVADGLEHLYHHYTPGSNQRLRVDIQLTPQNILIFPESGNPAGRWKINKFNAMVVTVDNGNPVYHNINIAGGNVHLGDTYLNCTNIPESSEIVAQRLTPSPVSDHIASAETVKSQYEAPEETIAPFLVIEESHVWSLGCIFLEVLIFSTALLDVRDDLSIRRLDLNKFREGLDGRHFFSNFSNDPSEPIFDIQGTVSSFLRDLSKKELFKEIVHDMPRLLCADYNDRHDTHKACVLIHHAVQKIKQKLKNPEPRMLATHQTSQSTPQSTRWAASVPLKEFAICNQMEVASPAHHWTLTILEQSIVALNSQKPVAEWEKVFLTKPIAGNFQRGHTATRYGLPSHTWHELHCSGFYGCLTSRCVNKQQPVAYYLFDASKCQTIEFKGGGPNGVGLKMVVPSSNGIFAFAYPQRIELWAIEGTKPDIISLPSEQSTVLRIAVSSEGDQLFVYTEQIESQSDIVQVWDIGIGRKPGHVGDAYINREDRRLNTKYIHLVACSVRNTCVVVHADLVVMAHATLTTLHKRKHYVGKSTSVKRGLLMTKNSLSLASDGKTLLLVDGKYELRAFTVHQAETSIVLRDDGSIRLPTKNPKWVLIQHESGTKYAIVIGTQMEECDTYITDLSDLRDGIIQLHNVIPRKSPKSSFSSGSDSLQSHQQPRGHQSFTEKMYKRLLRKPLELRSTNSD